MSDAPLCPNCGMEMQLNTAASNENVKQFICTCQAGKVFHYNVHKGQRKRDV